MPASTETYTSLLLVSVGGSPLPPAVAGLLERSRITDAANLPDSFELEFVDSAGIVLEQGGFAIGASVTLAVSQNGGDGPQKLLDAEVTALDREDVGGELRTRVRGLDPSHRLFRGRRVAAYVDMSVADIVQKVAQRAGVKVGSVSGPATIMAHTTQDNVSDWVFLKRLADACGLRVLGRRQAAAVRPADERIDGRVGRGERERRPGRGRARAQHDVPARHDHERRAGLGGRGAGLGCRGEGEGRLHRAREDEDDRAADARSRESRRRVLEPALRERRRCRRAAAAGQARRDDRRAHRGRLRRGRGADPRQSAHPLGHRDPASGVRRALRRPLHRHRVEARVQLRAGVHDDPHRQRHLRPFAARSWGPAPSSPLPGSRCQGSSAPSSATSPGAMPGRTGGCG